MLRRTALALLLLTGCSSERSTVRTTRLGATTIASTATPVPTTATVPLAVRDAEVVLPQLGFRLDPPPGWYAAGNTYGFLGTMWTVLAYAGTEPMRADPCGPRGENTEGCWSPVTSLPEGGAAASFTSWNTRMQVGPEELAAAVDRNGRRVIYRPGDNDCPAEGATTLGTAIVFRSDDAVVLVGLCGRGIQPAEGRRLLDELVDGMTFTG